MSYSLFTNKTIKLTKIVQKVTVEHMKKWKDLDEIDIFSAIAVLTGDMILNCALGQYHAGETADYVKNGKS